ncbi:GNAT family N-acetyltransferase [Sutcliffiella horikoshii]|uniref:GNAT family N-acetyltransferase n=1 Tax=Sutcliffiella horikoshii TaxID=79883 RepID=A0A5D4SQ78_9BACI|nr:GNAT family N-acetyltransferase [Sutcliffiella horikoshii]TYS64504.1 GNAT family N-acetyltransferase [Sutcliffiella horikoshii]
MDEIIMAFPSRDTIDTVAAFIARLNRQAHSHIGYCGRQPEEIASTLRNDFTDIPFEKAFILAYEEETLIGVIGFDADIEQKSAEVWGPFLEANQQEPVYLLFQQMMQLIPSAIEKLCMFPNKENNLAASVTTAFNFSKQSEQAILILRQNDFITTQNSMLPILPEHHYSEMINLHNLVFPYTYYNGEQILNRIGENRQVFHVEKEGRLAGYIYVEVEPEFSEASIEFFAVDKRYRGQSIGTELLRIAVSWIFSFNEIKELQLCVNTTNSSAIHLYQKAGFQLVDELYFFQKELKDHV